MSSLRQILGCATVLGLYCPISSANAQPPHRNLAVQRASRDLAISDLADAWQIQNVHALVVDNRFRIIVWDGGDMNIKVFDASGRPIRILGKRGEGPGELRQTGRMSVHGDTVWVSEFASNRLTSFDLLTGRARTNQVHAKSAGRAYLHDKLKDGYWFRISPPNMSGTGYSHALFSASGELRDTIVTFLPTPKQLRYDVLQANVRNGPVVAKQSSLQPFTTNPLLVSTSDGSRFVLAEMTASLNARSESMRLISLNLSGDTIWNRLIAFEPTPLTDEMYQSKIEQLVAPTTVRGVRMIGDRRMIADSLVRPRNLPAFTKLILSADGSIWIEHASASKSELYFWRFSRDGIYETCVAVPAGFRFMAATKKQLFGTRTDSDGLISVERYAVPQ